LAFGAVSASAQSTSNVFPQFVDGFSPDGTSWQTMIYASNLSGLPARCTVSLYGLSTARLSTPTSFSIPSGEWMVAAFAASSSPTAVGYARLDCNQPVTAALIYDLAAQDRSTVLQSSAVFASPQVHYALFPGILLSDWRTGMAIINDSDVTAGYTVAFTDSTGHVSATIVSVPPRGHVSRFVDEFVSVPTGPGVGSIEVWSQSGAPFAVMALQFSNHNSVCSALVPSY
jgi:hypothetical protein